MHRKRTLKLGARKPASPPAPLERGAAPSGTPSSRRAALLSLIAAGALLALIAPMPAAAQLGFLTDIAYSLVGKVFFAVSWIIGLIAGIAIALEAWLIEVILQLNTNVVNSTPVRVGFPVALSIANLVFVLGVIVVAIATILRYQPYGLKQILWRLVVAAILVNFSLVIAGTILNFADRLTLFFLDAVNPASGQNSYVGFSQSLAGAFNPQRSILLSDPSGANISRQIEGAGDAIGQLILPLTSSVFVAFAMIFIVITLGGLVVMLIVRYVYLGILLILMPFAWAGWVFPLSRSATWGKWWSVFLKQTFFAPLVVFFLWIAIRTSQEIAKGSEAPALVSFKEGNTGSAFSAVSEFFKGAFIGPIENMLQMTIILALMIGGLFAANALSITGAGAALGMARSVAGGLGGWAGRRAKQFGTGIFRREGAKNLAARLQTGAVRGGLLGRAAALPFRYAGRGMEAAAAAGGEKLVAQEKERTKGMTMDQKIQALSSATAPQKIAWLSDIKEAGRLHEVPHIEQYVGATDDEEKKKKAEFTRFGQTKLHDEVLHQSGYGLNRMFRGQEANEKFYGDERVFEYLRKAPNIGELVDAFFAPEKKIEEMTKGGRLPAGLGNDEATFRRIQKAIALAPAREFSPSNSSALFQKLVRGDTLNQFLTVAQGAAKETDLSIDQFTPGGRTWFKNSAARVAGVTVKDVYDISEHEVARTESDRRVESEIRER